MKASALLYTVAAISITFAGFAALLFTIRQAAGGAVSVLDRFLAKTVLRHMFMLTAGALLPPVLVLYRIPEHSVWVASAFAFAIPMLALLLTHPQRRRRAVGKAPPRDVSAVFVVFVGVGTLAIAAMLVAVLAGFQDMPAAYVTALLVNFFTSAYAFLTALDVIMHQPDAP